MLAIFQVLMDNMMTIVNTNMPSLVAQRLKHLPVMRETWVQSLGWEDPLEKEVVDRVDPKSSHYKRKRFFSFFFLVILFIYLFLLQYCVGFAIHQHESATGIHVLKWNIKYTFNVRKHFKLILSIAVQSVD